MTKERATALAASLDVGLDSPGVCPACLLFVASEIETGNEQRVAGRITSFAPVLWAEGLGDVVRDALGVARERGNDDAAVALDELSGRGRAQHDLSRGRAAARGRDHRGGDAFAHLINELRTIE
jgi:hypothetical protein